MKICSGSRKLPSPWTGQIAILYLCRHVKGSPKPDNHEKDAARYFSYQDIESFPEPVRYGVHGGVKKFYGVEPEEDLPTTLDHVIAAVAT